MIVRIDSLVQTLLIILYITFMSFEGLGEHELLTGMILVNWQILSCLAMLTLSKKRRTDCLLLFVITTTAFVLINTIFIIAGWYGAMMVLLVHLLPPILIIYYYIVTLFSLIPRSGHKGKFLPHTSF